MSSSKENTLILVICVQTLVICILVFQWVFFNSTYTKVQNLAIFKAFSEQVENQKSATNQNNQIVEINK